LPLPDFLWRDMPASGGDVVAGLALTGHFLHHHLLEPQGWGLPEARARLAERLGRLANATIGA
jgi:DNA repair protein RecO (recombination protein O)